MVTFARLRLYNVLIGLFQLLTGGAILGISDLGGKSSKLPWYTFFIASWSREDGAAAGDFYRPAPNQIADFPIAIWSGSFLLLSALDHLLVALPGVNKVYNRYLCRNRNPFRWAEYAVSASIMQVMIAQLCGVTDAHLLFAIAALMACTMLFGWNMEVLNGDRLPTFEYDDSNPKATPAPRYPSQFNGLPPAFIVGGASNGAAAAMQQQRIDWGPFIMGCWPFVAAIGITAWYFFQAVVNGDPPGFVWSLIFILTALYTLFAVNQVLQFKQARGWSGFAKAELWYMLLSLTSKQLLAWINYGGTKRFQN